VIVECCENTSLAKRECWCFLDLGSYSHMTLGFGHVGIVVGTTLYF
jgi:hypothetical protein